MGMDVIHSPPLDLGTIRGIDRSIDHWLCVIWILETKQPRVIASSLALCTPCVGLELGLWFAISSSEHSNNLPKMNSFDVIKLSEGLSHHLYTTSLRVQPVVAARPTSRSPISTLRTQDEIHVLKNKGESIS